MVQQHEHAFLVDALFQRIDALNRLGIGRIASDTPYRIGRIEDDPSAPKHLQSLINLIFCHKLNRINRTKVVYFIAISILYRGDFSVFAAASLLRSISSTAHRLNGSASHHTPIVFRQALLFNRTRRKPGSPNKKRQPMTSFALFADLQSHNVVVHIVSVSYIEIARPQLFHPHLLIKMKCSVLSIYIEFNGTLCWM